MAETSSEQPNRRDFLILATGAMGAVGAAAAVWPLISSMSPDASVQALATVEVNIGAIAEGQSITVLWRGRPVFVRHRTAAEIEAAKSAPAEQLIDPQPDEARVQKPEWLVVVGVCTHLGCVPVTNQGNYNGWFCPCHGSHYDTSGRVRIGPAPTNLEVPTYAFASDTVIRIG